METQYADCPICGTEDSLFATDIKGGCVRVKCKAKTPQGKMKCGLTIIYRKQGEKILYGWLALIAPQPEPEVPEKPVYKYGYEGIVSCPICRYPVRIAVAKNLFFYIKCAICPATIFAKQHYFDHLYSGRWQYIHPITEAFQHIFKPRKNSHVIKAYYKTIKQLQGQTANG